MKSVGVRLVAIFKISKNGVGVFVQLKSHLKRCGQLKGAGSDHVDRQCLYLKKGLEHLCNKRITLNSVGVLLVSISKIIHKTGADHLCSEKGWL